MALSGTIYSGNFGSNSFRLKLNWSATQNVSNNTSTISTNLYFESLQSWAKFNDGTNSAWNIAIDGQNTSGTANSTIAGNQSKWIAAATKTVTHGSDGTKSLSIGANHTIDISYSGSTIGTPRLDGTITLNPIARTSTVSLVGKKIGELGKYNDLFIKINRQSSAFTHTIRYAFGSKAANIATKINYVDYEWTIPADFATEVRNATTGWGRILCDTYNGNTKIGTSEVRFDITIPNNATYNPTISGISLSDTNAAVNAAVGAGYNIQKLSKIKMTATGATKYGATISSIVFKVKATNHAATMSGSTGTAYSTPSDSGVHAIVATVTDSRGRTATSTSSFTITAYVPPGISSFTASRRGLSSTTIDVAAVGRMSAIGAVNIATMTVWTSPVNSPIWTLQSTLTSSSGLGLSTGVLPVLNMSITDSYEVKIEIYDKLTTTPSVQIISVGTAIFPMSWGKTGVGVGTVFNPTGSALQVVGGIEADRYVSEAIPTGADLNNYINEGFYYCNTDAVAGTITNIAISSAFSLFVEKHAGYKQTFTAYKTNPQMWIRNYYNGSWGGWKPVVDDTSWQNVPLTGVSSGSFLWYRYMAGVIHILGNIGIVGEKRGGLGIGTIPYKPARDVFFVGAPSPSVTGFPESHSAVFSIASSNGSFAMQRKSGAEFFYISHTYIGG